MKICELLELISKLPPDAEVVVYRDGNGECYVPSGQIVPLGSCYFGGDSPDSDEDADCLRLDIY